MTNYISIYRWRHFRQTTPFNVQIVQDNQTIDSFDFATLQEAIHFSETEFPDRVIYFWIMTITFISRIPAAAPEAEQINVRVIEDHNIIETRDFPKVEAAREFAATTGHEIVEEL